MAGEQQQESGHCLEHGTAVLGVLVVYSWETSDFGVSVFFSADCETAFSTGLGFAGVLSVGFTGVSLAAFKTIGSIRLSGSPRALHSWAVTSIWSSRIPLGITTSKVAWESSSVVVVWPLGVLHRHAYERVRLTRRQVHFQHVLHDSVPRWFG